MALRDQLRGKGSGEVADVLECHIACRRRTCGGLMTGEPLMRRWAGRVVILAGQEEKIQSEPFDAPKVRCKRSHLPLHELDVEHCATLRFARRLWIPPCESEVGRQVCCQLLQDGKSGEIRGDSSQGVHRLLDDDGDLGEFPKR